MLITNSETTWEFVRSAENAAAPKTAYEYQIFVFANQL